MISRDGTFATLALLSVLAVNGCYVDAGTAPPAADPTVVEVPPPPPPAPAPEAIPPAPGPEYTWVPGAHRWNGHAYEYQRGHYERKPHPSAQYAPGHWEKQQRGHKWVEGHWQQ
jgi:hypothetical protein